jgi:hypothetical protein
MSKQLNPLSRNKTPTLLGAHEIEARSLPALGINSICSSKSKTHLQIYWTKVLVDTIILTGVLIDTKV